MNKKLLVLVFCLILAATIAAGFYLDKNRIKPQSKSSPVSKEEFSIKENAIEGSLPKAFPEDMMIEVGSQIIEAKESETNDNRVQSQLTTTTKKTLVKAVNDYIAYFETKNWVEIESLFVSTPTKVTAVMQYQNDRLTIVSQSNPETGEKTVRIDLVQVSVNK